MKKLKSYINKIGNIINEQNLIHITDLDGKITFTNNNFCEVSGYNQEELIGQNQDILHHPNISNEYYKDILKIINNKEVFKGTIENLSKSGKSFWLRGVIVPFIEDEEIKEYIYISEDATKKINQQIELEQLEDQEALDELKKATTIHNNNMLESIPLPSFIIQDKKIINKNELFEELFLIESINEDDIISSILGTSYGEYILDGTVNLTV